MNIKEVLNKGYVALKTAGIDSPKLKARLLLQFTLNKSYQYLVVYDTKEIEKSEYIKYMANIEKVRKGTPVEYVTHQKEFMKLNFYVDESVLIPRSDTEIVVENVLKYANKIYDQTKEQINILDLCTGSGAIAISLKKYLGNKAKISAIDISKKALEVAKKNAVLNDVADIEFIESNLFEKVEVVKKIEMLKYDIIVSNPPYIKRDVLKHLPQDVRCEPKLALDGGYTGLDFYTKIIPESKEFLKTNGYLIFEIRYDIANGVLELIEKEKVFKNSKVIKDYAQKDRCIVTRLSE